MVSSSHHNSITASHTHLFFLMRSYDHGGALAPTGRTLPLTNGFQQIFLFLFTGSTKRVFAEHPEVKKMLWGGEFWSDGYFVSSVGKFTSENVIREYIKNQGKEESYRQLYLNLPKGE